jgi:lysophospholipase L1-like esterase
MLRSICLIGFNLLFAVSLIAEPLRVVTLGDSITKGVRAGVAEDQTFAAELQRQLRAGQFPDAEVINVGIGGEQAGQGLARLARDVVAKQPNIVTIMYGHNDSYIDAGKTTVRVPVPRFRADLSQLVERLREAGITPILMTPPAYAEKSGPNGAGEHCNVKLARYAEVARQVAETLQVPLVDHFAAWEEISKKGTDLNEWTTDGYHPNPKGHVDLAARMLPRVKEQIPVTFLSKVPFEVWPELKFKLSGGNCFRQPGQLILYETVTGSRQITFPRLNNVVRGVCWRHADKEHHDGVSLSQTPSEWTVKINENVPADAHVVLLVDGMPRLALTPAVSRPGPDGVITLSARDAIVHGGDKLQFEPLTHKNTVGYWVNPSEYAEWSYELDQPGEFEVEILQGCGGHAGSDVELGFKDGTVPFVVEETGHFQNFVWRKIGKIALKESGVRVMSLKCKKLAKGAVMDMRQIRLVPVGLEPPAARDMRDVAPDLVPPDVTVGSPAPGRRVIQTATGFESPVQHVLYLPTNHGGNRKWPIIVEWTGNGPYRNEHGDVSTGMPKHGLLGYGLAGSHGAICLSLPLLSEDGKQIVTQWWGNSPTHDPSASIRYLKQAIADTCEKHGGDPSRVILVGFSRGAIAVNAVGLANDEAAGLWKAAVCFSHYDGVREWPYTGNDPESALKRLQRLGQKPQFIVSESASQLEATRAHLTQSGVPGQFTFATTGFVNHSDRWALRPSPARQQIRDWLKQQMAD